MIKSKLVQLLRQETDVNLVKLFLCFVVVGVTNSLVLVFVHDVTDKNSEDGTGFRMMALFFLCVGTFLVTKRAVNTWLTRYVQQAVFQLRMRILAKLGRSSLISFEGLDRSRLINAVSENVQTIDNGVKHLGEGLPAGIMLLCSFIYVAAISMPAFYMVVVWVAAATVVIWSLNRSVRTDLDQAIGKENEFLGSFHQFLDGFKELKLNREKARDLYQNHIQRASSEARALNTKASLNIVSAELYSYVFFYAALGSTLFLLPRLAGIDQETTLSIVTILLFLVGNGTVFVQALPNLTKADVAIDNVWRLEAMLDDLEAEEEIGASNPWPTPEAVGDITIRDLHFTYGGVANQAFTVEVGDLTIRQGEILYIQGGNGSGKSTFLKLLTGLYTPQRGTIACAGVPVTPGNLVHYRELFSAIFADFHLFDRLYGMLGLDEARVDQLLDELELREKTGYEAGRFRNLNLSTGQRKRLAILTLMLEDRPICVFDEVAADQDVRFRRYIYEVLFRDLQRQGKTVIAITHDDRYFETGDRVVKMEYGRIVDLRTGADYEAPPGV